MLAAQAITAQVSSPEQAVRACGGIYGAAPTSHFSLAARVVGYTQQHLEDALVVDRSLVRVPAMRSSVYLLPTDLAVLGFAMVSERNFSWMERALEMDRRSYDRIVSRVEAVLRDRPGTASDIRAALGDHAPEGPKLTLLLRLMGNEGRILKTATRGGIRSQRFEYAVTRAWIDVPGVAPSLIEALDVLTPMWLEAHGPASVADLAWWAGVTLETAAAALGRSDAVRVDVDGLTDEMWAQPSWLDAPSAAPGGVHLLPVWDVYLMSHRDRTRYLPEDRRPFIVDPSGNVANVILDDGIVVGVWDLDGDTLLYGALPEAAVDEAAVVRAAERFAGIAPIGGIRAVEPRPLAGRGQNAFQAPLRR